MRYIEAPRRANTLGKQLGWLEWWLRKPAWTLRETASLFAGVLPDGTGHARGFTDWLPGREPWGRDPEERAALREAWEDGVRRDIARLELHLSTIPHIGIMLPRDLLKVVAEKGVLRPPWLQAAIADPECKRLLPLAIQPYGENYWKNPGQRKRVAQTLSDNHDYEEQVLFAFELWQKGKSTGSIRKSMQSSFTKSLDSTLVNWIKIFKTDNSPDRRLADVRQYKRETANR